MSHCVYNTTNEKQTVRALGNWFEFAPKQVKFLNNEEIARFIGIDRRHQGMVNLDERFDDPEFKISEEGKAALKTYDAQGIEPYIAHLRSLIYNETVALKLDLDVANLKMDPTILMSDSTLGALKVLASYQKTKEDVDQKRGDEVRKLLKDIAPLEKTK